MLLLSLILKLMQPLQYSYCMYCNFSNIYIYIYISNSTFIKYKETIIKY